jgi:hypothetical protein
LIFLAHLLPKARDDAFTWNYPGSAVLGLDMSHVAGDITKKAVLRCIDLLANPPIKYPGVRNLLCNILRMSNQGPLFDNSPRVFIFPIYRLGAAREWAGQGYDAIIFCASEDVAQRIGMTNVTLENAKKATLSEINTAAALASTLCEFLAHSVLEKEESEVEKYQDAGEREAHHNFRLEGEIPVPKNLSALPQKPVFKISFSAHNPEHLRNGHPAPDPMLLAFKSCNNWCRKYAGFRMVAGAEPEDFDDLSEEGRQNLQAYNEWQAAKESTQQHNDLMNLFGLEGGTHSIEFAT